MQKLKLIAAGILISIFCSELAAPVLAESDLFTKAQAAVGSLVTLKKQLNDRYQTFLNAAGTVSDLKDKLQPVELTINTLTEQIKVLDENIRRATINLGVIQVETRGVQLALTDLFDLVEVREAELMQSRKLLDEFLRLAYAETMRYTDWQTGRISALKFLLAGGSLADAELNQTYLTVLQSKSAELVTNLQAAAERYDQTKQQLLEKRGRLIVLQQDLMTQKSNLEEMQQAKVRILSETRGQEQQYRKLIEENEQQQAEVLLEIATLKDNMATINEKLTGLGQDLGAEKLQALLKEQGLTNVSGLAFPGHTPRLIWPVDPSAGITAYYLDADYVKVFGVPHQAIDIREWQGTPISAAAPGVVVKAKDNGFGYSYVMLAHAGELATVYGHVSQIMVKEGDLVRAGDVIGLSGGSPGTRGAGYMTTGPHLHFEVFDHGTHVNPLDYLPLENLAREYIPAQYLKEAK